MSPSRKTATEARRDREERERIRRYQERVRIHEEQRRRRHRDNVTALSLAGVVVLLSFLAQTLYFTVGPGFVRPPNPNVVAPSYDQLFQRTPAS